MSPASVPGLSGGLLNGDVSSDNSPVFGPRPLVLTTSDPGAVILSRRGGGGTGFGSRRNSPDLLGGGGDGAFALRGDRGGGIAGAGEGVVGRCKGLGGFGEPLGVTGLETESGLRKAAA